RSNQENCEKSMMAKNLSENGLQKPSKTADSLRTYQPGRNPEFSASPLCPIFTRISAVPENGQESGMPYARKLGSPSRVDLFPRIIIRTSKRRFRHPRIIVARFAYVVCPIPTLTLPGHLLATPLRFHPGNAT